MVIACIGQASEQPPHPVQALRLIIGGRCSACRPPATMARCSQVSSHTLQASPPVWMQRASMDALTAQGTVPVSVSKQSTGQMDAHVPHSVHGALLKSTNGMPSPSSASTPVEHDSTQAPHRVQLSMNSASARLHGGRFTDGFRASRPARPRLPKFGSRDAIELHNPTGQTLGANPIPHAQLNWCGVDAVSKRCLLDKRDNQNTFVSLRQRYHLTYVKCKIEGYDPRAFSDEVATGPSSKLRCSFLAESAADLVGERLDEIVQRRPIAGLDEHFSRHARQQA